MLENLDLSHNKISKLQGLSFCSRLRRLFISCNKLQSTALIGSNGSIEPPVLLSLPCLSVLDLSSNTNLAAALALTMDKSTYFSFCKLDQTINKIDSNESEYGIFPPFIRDLRLSNCNLVTIVGLRKLRYLEILDLSINFLIDFDEIDNITSSKILRHANFQDNPLVLQSFYLYRMLQKLPFLKLLDEEELTSFQRVQAHEFFSEDQQMKASRDHRINTFYRYTNQQKLMDFTLKSLNTVYPLLLLIGPSANKKELQAHIMEKYPQHFFPLVSHTDRPRRVHNESENSVIHERGSTQLSTEYTEISACANEIDGEDYCFVDRDTFQSMKACGEFVQTAQLNGYNYGLTWKAIESAVYKGQAGLFRGEIEALYSIKMTAFEPRVLLCLPRDKATHEYTLRKKLPNSWKSDSVAETTPADGLTATESFLCDREAMIQANLERSGSIYEDATLDHPGWFDTFIDNSDLSTVSPKIDELIKGFLDLDDASDSSNRQPSGNSSLRRIP
ncbi:hypothetical protein Ciccas_012314, partial [Cichlidogyrus casuarinus]